MERDDSDAPAAVYQPAEGCIASTIDGATVVLSPTLDYVELDPTGTAIWEVLHEHGTADAIAARLAERFDATVERVRPDVERYLAELVDVGLARRAP